MESGRILTFYSYKGGAGRSMGLANVAAMLSKWRRKVLVVDWDLEAPGIEAYFNRIDRSLLAKRKTTPGVIDLIKAISTGQSLDWHDCLLSVRPFTQGEEIKIISAGKNDDSYIHEVQRTDWNHLFDSKGLGTYIETLRTAWKEEFDSILIDSRTGITDIGGVCTIHLPDYLVVWFTTNWTSVNGVNHVARRARVAQDSLPFDRNQLLVIPVPSRDESRTELEKANKWKDILAHEFSQFYKEWIPADLAPNDVIEKLRIPYIPYWSFEEGLPVCEEDTRDPSSISAAYEVLSRLIFFDLRWEEVDKDPEQSIEYLSRASEVDIHRFGPDLADKFFDQALDFWKEKDKDASSEATRKAVEIWGRLAETDFESYGLKLARAKKFLSELVDETDEQGSITEANGAIEVYRRLSKIDKLKFQEEAATSLTELSIRLHDKETKGAIETLEEATDIQKRLVRSNPRRVQPELASGLYDLSNWFFQAQQFSKALVAIQEAVPIYRHLVSVDRERFEPELADSLLTLSECLLETREIYGALEGGREAVEIYKRLAQRNSTRYESGLVKSFNALLDILSAVDMAEVPNALAYVQEAVSLFRNLTEKIPEQYESDLAKSLNMLPDPLLKKGNIGEALRAQGDAIEIFRRLLPAHPAQYESELALSLINLSKLLSENNNPSGAQEAAREAAEILKRLAKDSPSKYNDDLERALELVSQIDQ